MATGTPLTYAQWIAKSNVICGRTNAKTQSTTIKNSSEFARVLPQVALYDKTEAAELSQLVAPPAKAADWRKIVEGLQLFGEYTTRVAEYAQAKNDNSAVPLVAQAKVVHERLTNLALHDRLKECGVL